MDGILKFQTHLIKSKVRKYKGSTKVKPIIEDDGDNEFDPPEFFS